MDVQDLSGHCVTVISARGAIRRTVVADLGDVLVLGSIDDYNSTKVLGIDRFAIGFRRSDIIAVESGIDTSVSIKHNVQYEQAEHDQAGPDCLDVGGGQQPSERQPHGGRVDQHRDETAG